MQINYPDEQISSGIFFHKYDMQILRGATMKRKTVIIIAGLALAVSAAAYMATRPEKAAWTTPVRQDYVQSSTHRSCKIRKEICRDKDR